MKTKELLLLLLLSISILIIQIFIDVRYSFIGDSLIKGIQIESLKINQYKSQDLIYRAYDYDKEYIFQPLPIGLVTIFNDKIYSVFPISFAFLYSLIPIKVNLLPFLNFIPVFILLLSIKFILNFQFKSLFILLFGTVLFPISLDLSENPIFLMLVGMGFVVFIKFLETFDKKYFLYSSLFLGIAMWFRLEAILIYSVMIFSFGIYILLEKRFSLLVPIIPGGLVFITLFIIFGIFNYLLYDHILGFRYIVNFQHNKTIKDYGFIFLDIVFTRLESGIPKFGFFFYSPILLFLIIIHLLNFSKIKNIHKIITILSILLIISIGFNAPNAGYTVTGRYLSALAFPLVYLYNENYSLLLNTKIKKFVSYFCFIWSILIFIIVLAILKFSYKNVKDYNLYFQKIDSEVFVFPSSLGAGFVGLEYLNKKIISLKSKDGVDRFLLVLKEHKIQKFSIFFENKNLQNMLVDNNKSFEYEPETIINQISNLGYSCINIENFLLLSRTDCKLNR